MPVPESGIGVQLATGAQESAGSLRGGAEHRGSADDNGIVAGRRRRGGLDASIVRPSTGNGQWQS